MQPGLNAKNDIIASLAVVITTANKLHYYPEILSSDFLSFSEIYV